MYLRFSDMFIFLFIVIELFGFQSRENGVMNLQNQHHRAENQQSRAGPGVAGQGDEKGWNDTGLAGQGEPGPQCAMRAPLQECVIINTGHPPLLLIWKKYNI